MIKKQYTIETKKECVEKINTLKNDGKKLKDVITEVSNAYDAPESTIIGWFRRGVSKKEKPQLTTIYTPEFKEMTVSQVMEGKSINEVAEENKISTTSLRSWMAPTKKQSMPPKKKDDPSRQELLAVIGELYIELRNHR